MSAFDICLAFLILSGSFALICLGILLLKSSQVLKDVSALTKEVEVTIDKVNKTVDDVNYKMDQMNAPVMIIRNGISLPAIFLLILKERQELLSFRNCHSIQRLR